MMRIQLPICVEDKQKLRSFDYIYLTGKLYTMRDAAHKRLLQMKKDGLPLPIDLNDACIYYTGPTPEKNGHAGSIGPTTAYRMDAFMGELPMINCTIGKGPRAPFVRDMAKKGVLYLDAIGGIGAKLSLQVRSIRLIAFEDLGPEAIYELQVEDFPVIVAYDVIGNTIFQGE
ncbi:MAG: FumA C-terminus/TtdB family hydratase beta subunit [Bacilli bacterium]